MKKINLKFICFTLIFILTTTSIVSSYTSVYCVNAEKDDIDEIIAGILAAILGTVGAFVETPALIVSGGILGCYAIGSELGDYITDNGDGTITISPEGMQATIDALQQWEKVQGFNEEDINKFNSGLPYTYNFHVVCIDSGDGYNSTSVYSGVSEPKTGFVAGVIYPTVCSANLNIDTYKGEFVTTYSDGRVIKGKKSGSSSVSFSYITSCEFMGNFPIFASKEAYRDFLNTGKGYKNAINYNPLTIHKGSNFSPTYNGGSVTFSKDKLKKLPDIIDDIPEDTEPDKAIDIIINWLTDDNDDDEPSTEPSTGDDEPSTEPSTGDDEPNTEPDTGDNDTTEDSSVIDLSGVIGWLKKIYNKLCDILDSLEKGFDDTIEQLKAIKRWTALGTIASWLDYIESLLSNPENGFNKFVTDTINKFKAPVELLVTKFPFSIPWDVVILLEFFADTPTVPQFKLPFQIPALGIDYSVDIDLTPFEPLSKISRVMLTILYIWGLMKLTTRLIKKEVLD